MQLRDYLGIVKKRWFVIVGMTVLVLLIVLIWSFIQKPTYKAEATLMVSAVSTNPDQLSAIQTIQQLLETIRKIATARPVLQAASDSLGGERSVDELNNAVSSQVLTDTQLIKISASDGDATYAMLEANATAGALIDFVKQNEGDTPNYQIQKIEPALVPTSPVSPKPLRNGIIGGFVGLVLGCIGAAVLESLDVSVKGKEEVANLTEKPVLGEIPLFKNGKLASVGRNESKDPGILEQTRTLRTNIQYLSIKGNLRVILVTSPSLGEGKSFVSMQLGRAFAAQGKRTVLIDADLRKVDAQFVGPAQRGLTDLIMGTVELQDVLRATDMQLLRFLPSGPLPPNPSELLDSTSMQNVLATLRKECDAVVIDTCPIDMFSDPLVLAPKSDGVILVVAARETNGDSVKTATELLSGPNINLLGSVLNKTKKSTRQDYYYYRSDSLKHRRRTKQP